MTKWVRLWEDMPTDPKWRVIAKRSGCPLPYVIAVFNFMMINAGANSEDRGCLSGWDDEDIAAALDIEPEQVEAIRSAMQGKILEGDRLTGWERRQPKSNDDSYQRVKEWRQKQRHEAGNDPETGVTRCNGDETAVTRCNAPETDTDTDTDTDTEKVVRQRKRASRLPDDWVLPDDYREAARQRGLADAEINRQADRMRNWSLSATGGAKLDWFRTWLNWIDSAPKNVTPIPARSSAFQLSKPAANF